MMTPDAGIAVAASGTAPIDPLDHQGLVGIIAKRFLNRGVDYKELKQEGNIGLLKACITFDPSEGFSFSTYATPFIKHSIADAIPSLTKFIHIPHDLYSMMLRLKNGKLSQSDVKKSDHDRISDARNTLDREFAHGELVLSWIEGRGGDSNGDDDEGPVAIPGSPRLHSLLSKLTPLQIDILDAHYGLSGDEPEGFPSISRRTGIPMGRLSNIYKSALHRMRASGNRRPGRGGRLAS